MKLQEILEKHSPVEAFIRFNLKKGTEFASSRSFDISDKKAGALMVLEDWLFIPSSVVNDLYVFPEGQLKAEAFSNKSADKVKPFDKLYVVGDYEMTFKVNLIKNGSVKPLQRFLDTFGDEWFEDVTLPNTWNYVPLHYVSSKSDFKLKADLRALDWLDEED
jgi:hypothetical protein